MNNVQLNNTYIIKVHFLLLPTYLLDYFYDQIFKDNIHSGLMLMLYHKFIKAFDFGLFDH